MTTSEEPSDDRERIDTRILQTAFDAVDDIVYVIDEDGNSAFWNATLEERSGYSSEEIATMAAKDFLPREQWEHAPGLIDTIDAIEDRRIDLDLATKSGETIPHEFRGTTYEDPTTGERFRFGVARDITDRLRRERSLRRQRDELATLDRVNELILETVRELIQTSSREAVERTVCERVAASEFYRLAWIGEREFGGDRIVPREVAGEGADYLDAVTFRAREDQSPAAQALATGEVQTAHVDDPAFEPWRDAARDNGLATVAAVPLRHDDAVYGVLEICSSREDPFSEREQSGFDALGRTVGIVVHAARSRDLLFADSVVELAFDATNADIPLVDVAVDRVCTLELDGYVATDEAWLLYLTVEGADPDAVVAAIADASKYPESRVVSDGDAFGQIELRVADASLLHTVATLGVTIASATAGPDAARVVLEAPTDADVREVVDRIQREFPGMDLHSHREHDRDVTTVGRPDGPLDDLTDRQREALTAAYRAGYFAWPRESSAEQVADSLGIDNSTLHGHLRKAQARLLGTVIDAE